MASELANQKKTQSLMLLVLGLIADPARQGVQVKRKLREL
jgi:hypothetical protein